MASSERVALKAVTPTSRVNTPPGVSLDVPLAQICVPARRAAIAATTRLESDVCERQRVRASKKGVSPRTSTPKALARARRVAYDGSVVGRRIAIQWPADPGKPWYEGIVHGLCGGKAPTSSSKHWIYYDDGERRRHSLGYEERLGRLRWL